MAAKVSSLPDIARPAASRLVRVEKAMNFVMSAMN
jgi:hypothetical protein